MLTATLRFGGRVTGRVLSLSVALVVSLALLLVIAGGAVVWRLAQGPINVTRLVNHYAPVLAPGVTVAQATIALGRLDGRHTVTLEATGLARSPAPGRLPQSIPHATVTLPLLPLLAGRILPETLALDGAQLQLALPQAGPAKATPDGGTTRLLAALHQLAVTNLQLTLIGLAAGKPVQLTHASADLQRTAGGVLSGTAAATVATGGVSADAQAIAAYGPHGATVVAALTPVSPAALAQAVPALAGLGVLDAPIGLHGSASFGPALNLVHAALHADIAAGTVQLPAKGGGTATARFTAATLDADGSAEAVRLRALHLVVASPSGGPATNLVLSGRIDRTAAQLTAHLALGLDQLLLADLPAIWPPGVGGGSRDWLTKNLTGGTAHDAHITMTLTAAADGSNLDVTEAGGTATGDDVTLWWLRPVPPLTHLHAALVWQSPDVLLITGSGARQGAIAATNSSIRISGLTVNHQFGQITTDLAGPLADVITLLKNPRLQLLSKRPLSFENPSGTVAAHMTVTIPLEDKVTVDQIPIHVKGQVSDTHLGGIAAGKDLDGGQLAFDVTNDGMTIGGPARLDHFPGQLTVQLDFRDGPKTQVLLNAHAAVTATAAAAKAAGLSAVGLESGRLPVTLDYAERRDNTATVKVAMDLTDAAFVSPFGWSKVTGTPGAAGGQAQLDHGKLVGLDSLHAEAPGLAIAATSDMVDGRPAVVHIHKGEIGRSSATGTVILPHQGGDEYRVTLAGPQLDLEGRLSSQNAPAAGSAEPKRPRGGVPYVVDLRFDRVLLGHDRGLTAVALTASGTGGRLSSARLSTGGEAHVRAELVTIGPERRVTVAAADLGRLLHDTDLATELDGGTLSLTGAFDDRQPNSPFDGSIDLRRFRVRGAPVAAKILQALTIYGIGDALRGPGLAFDRFLGQFRLDGPVLDIRNARAFSSSLGVTASGAFDFASKTVDLHGTIVPAYFFNALPGKVPLLGRLFSPEKGSGLFAADFAMTGSLTAPSVSVNPLSALTPGITRRLFRLF